MKHRDRKRKRENSCIKRQNKALPSIGVEFTHFSENDARRGKGKINNFHANGEKVK
jgi:hypothetical protein